MEGHNQATVCNICGAAGFNNCLAKCNQCNEGAEHTYCMRTILDIVPVDWMCELCILRQKSTINKNRLMDPDLQLGQSCKKQVFRRVGKDARSLKRSTLENMADRFVSASVETGLARAKEQFKVCATFKENLSALETRKAASISNDDSKEHVRTDLSFVSMTAMKRVDEYSKLQSEVNAAFIAPGDKHFESKIELAAVKKAISPAEERDTEDFESTFKPYDIKLPSIKSEHEEQLDKLNGTLANTEETSGHLAEAGNDTAFCKMPAIIADSVTESVGLESVPPSKNICSASQCCISYHVANDSCRQQHAGGENMVPLTDYVKIIEKIKQLGEPSDLGLPTDAKGVSTLDMVKERHIKNVTEEILKGIACTFVPSEVLEKSQKGHSTMDDRPIDREHLKMEGTCLKENLVEQMTEGSCKMLQSRENINDMHCLTQPPGAETQESICMQEVHLAGSSSRLIDIPMSADLSEAASLCGIDTISASSMEQSKEPVEHGKCAAAKECPFVPKTQVAQETPKRYSGTGINPTTMALLKRISRRNIFPRKSHSAKWGKSGVSNTEEATSVAREKVSSLQQHKKLKNKSLTIQTKKYKRKNHLASPSKAQVTLNPSSCSSSSVLESQVPSVSVEDTSATCSSIASSKAQVFLNPISSPSSSVLESNVSSVPVKDMSATFSSMSQQNVEAAATQKDIADADERSQAKKEVCQGRKVEEWLPVLQPTKSPKMKKYDDKRKEDDAAVSEAPNSNMSNGVRGDLSSMKETAVLQLKEGLETNIVADFCNLPLPSSSKFPDGAATIIGAKEITNEPKQKAATREFMEDGSLVPLASGSLGLIDPKVLTDHLNNSADSDHLGSAQQHLSEQKARESRAAVPSAVKDKWSDCDATVSRGILKNTSQATSDEEAIPGEPASSEVGDQNHADKRLFCGINLSPNKHASEMRLAANRTMPMVTVSNDQPSYCRDGVKNLPRKKVRFSIDDDDDLRRERHQSLSSMRKGFKKDSFHIGQKYKLPDHLEKSPSFRSKNSSVTGSRTLKFSHHTEDSSRQTSKVIFGKDTGRSRTCEEGCYTGYSNAKIKDDQRDWGEFNSQFWDQGTVETRSDLLHRGRSSYDSAFNGRHRIYSEAGHSTDFREVREVDKLRDWRSRDSVYDDDMHLGWRRDSVYDDDMHLGWRRKYPLDHFDKQREWIRNESLTSFSRQKGGRNTDLPELSEKSEIWKKRHKPDFIDKEKDLRWKFKSDLNGKEGKRWGSNDSWHLSGGGLPDVRHVKRCRQGFQDFGEGEQWKYDPRIETASNSNRPYLASDCVDSSCMCSEMPAHVSNCVRLDTEHSFQLRSREQAGIERKSLGLDSIHPSSAKRLDRSPGLKPPQYSRAHQKYTFKVQKQDACTASQLDTPNSNHLVQERRGFPSSQVLWNGCFDVTSKTRWSTIYREIKAFPSNVADPKVCEALLALPSMLHLEEIKRGEGNGSWPRAFQEFPPTRQSIGMYFCSQDMDSDNTWYQPLVQHLNARSLALRSEMDSIQLLIYPSQLLPVAEQRWDGRLFLWGVFRANKSTKVTIEDSRPLSQREHGNDFGSPEASGEVIDMDIDMVGGRDAAMENFKELSPPLPPGFLPPPPPLPGFLPPPPPLPGFLPPPPPLP